MEIETNLDEHLVNDDETEYLPKAAARIDQGRTNPKEFETMTRTIFFAAFLIGIGASICSGQEHIIQPYKVADFPDIHQDSIQAYKAEAAVVKKKSVKKLTKKDEAYWLNPLWMNGDFFNTRPIGCSWYCASGPDQMTASSEKPETDSVTFSAANAHDFNMQTAWVEGGKKWGKGSTIEFLFALKPDVTVKELIIYNGYCKDIDTWQAYSRAKRLEVIVNEETIGTLHLEDTYFAQSFKIGSFSGGNKGRFSLTLKIVEVYPGDQFHDTAISEVNFSGKGGH